MKKFVHETKENIRRSASMKVMGAVGGLATIASVWFTTYYAVQATHEDKAVHAVDHSGASHQTGRTLGDLRVPSIDAIETNQAAKNDVGFATMAGTAGLVTDVIVGMVFFEKNSALTRWRYTPHGGQTEKYWIPNINARAFGELLVAISQAQDAYVDDRIDPGYGAEITELPNL
jgi:hypothetical protein